jgi:hypothetical protein
MKSTHYCLECGKPISDGLYEFSTEVYRFPLCSHHLYLIEKRGITDQALRLYFSLKKSEFPETRQYPTGITGLARSVTKAQLQ